MKSYGFDKVYLQEVIVPRWVRGDREELEILGDKTGFKPEILALGGSVGTEGFIEGKVIEVRSFGRV